MTKVISSILGVPGDKTDAACAYYRVIWPLQALTRQGFIEGHHIVPAVNGTRPVEFDHGAGTGGGKDPTRLNRVNNYDAVMFQRQPRGDVTHLIKACQAVGIKVIFDIDDAALTIPQTNPNYMIWGRDKVAIRRMAQNFILGGGQLPEVLRGMSPEQIADQAQVLLRGILTNIRLADLVTVTTPHLAQEYGHLNQNIHVLPNQMDVEYWSGLRPIQHPPEEVWVGWAGGWTHLDDLKMVVGPMCQILERNPNVRFVIVGFTQARELIFQDLPQDQIIDLPWAKDFRSYHNFVASADIILAPSQPIQFNQGKSDIRLMEAWLCKRPCVGSPTTYGETLKASGGGLVAKNAGGWLRGINRLIRDPDLRQQMGEAGYRYVTEQRTYDANAHRWAAALESIA